VNSENVVMNLRALWRTDRIDDSFIDRAVVGLSTMTTKPACPMKSVITSRTNASSLVNMFR
jgi:hypothetical protein